MGEQAKKVHVEWDMPEDIISRYANNILIQHTPNEFIVSFFETRPPLIFGDPNEQMEQWEKLQSIKSSCVARIIINPGRMEEFIKALQVNYQDYISMSDNEED